MRRDEGSDDAHRSIDIQIGGHPGQTRGERGKVCRAKRTGQTARKQDERISTGEGRTAVGYGQGAAIRNVCGNQPTTLWAISAIKADDGRATQIDAVGDRKNASWS